MLSNNKALLLALSVGTWAGCANDKPVPMQANNADDTDQRGGFGVVDGSIGGHSAVIALAEGSSHTGSGVAFWKERCFLTASHMAGADVVKTGGSFHSSSESSEVAKFVGHSGASGGNLMYYDIAVGWAKPGDAVWSPLDVEFPEADLAEDGETVGFGVNDDSFPALTGFKFHGNVDLASEVAAGTSAFGSEYGGSIVTTADPAAVRPGDSGGALLQDGKLVGVTHGGYTSFPGLSYFVSIAGNEGWLRHTLEQTCRPELALLIYQDNASGSHVSISSTWTKPLTGGVEGHSSSTAEGSTWDMRPGESVTLTAVPGPDMQLVHWAEGSGGFECPCAGDTGPCSFVVPDDWTEVGEGSANSMICTAVYEYAGCGSGC